jgi:hypothetical protein
MNLLQARQILDELKDGLVYNLAYTKDTINKALELTGDLDGFQPSIRATSGASDKVGFTEGLDCLRQAKGRGVGS